MPYSPTSWVEGVTKVGPINLNHLEGGLQTADTNATAAAAAAAAAATTANAAIPKSVATNAGDILYATGSAVLTRLGIGAAGTVLHGGASAPAWSTLLLSEISGYPADATKFARGDGTWAAPPTTPPPTPATTLPGSPANLQQAILVDSTSAPTYAWMLQFSTAASAWVFLGGSPAIAEVTAGETTASASYTDLTTVGPSLTLPRAGTYIYTVTVEIVASATAQTARAAVKLGAAAAADTDSVQASPGGGLPITATRVRKIAGAAASDVWKVQYSSSSGTAQFLRRELAVLPVLLT